MDYDEVLKKCGDYGMFQFLVLMCYAYSNLLSTFHYFSQTLISLTPPHWCYNEQLEDLSTSEINSVFTEANIANSRCTALKTIGNDSMVPDYDSKCDNWIYHRDFNYETITTELNWVCEDSHKLAIGQSLFFLGACVGTIGFGTLSDRIGRLPTLLLSCLTGAFGDFITIFASGLPFFAASRFISGLSCDTQFYMIYILAFEYLSPEKRTFGLNIVSAVFYCCFTCMSPWLAVWVGTWRKYLLIASLPSLMILLYPTIVNESAHWLITKKKNERAIKCLKNVAKWNKKHVDDQVFEDFIAHYKNKALEQEKNKRPNASADSFFHLFRTKSMAKKPICLIIKTMIVTLTFDIVSRNIEVVGISPFIMFSVSALAYFPGGLTIIFLQNIIGRKGMAFLSLAMGAVITAITGYLIAAVNPIDNAILLCVMIFLGRYAVIVAYDAEVMYASELLPTSVRGQGLSIIHVAGYGFSFLSPYVIFLGNFYKPLPSFICASLMLFGALLCLILPETMNKKLPESVQDFETFGNDQKWYDFPFIPEKIRMFTIQKSHEIS